jgi:cytochrome P450
MEATTATAPPIAARPARRGLPPGPRLPRIAQTAIWSRRARRPLYAGQDRYGDVFTLRIIGEGTWVVLADPDAVKQVFTGDPRVFHAGEAKLERLREEAVAGDDDAYLTATIQETLRLRPVISIVLRHLTEPVEIGGWELPAGVSVALSIYLAHRNPEVYPDPESFRPERFLESPPGTYTWIPFGGGVRRCLGAAFAQFEMSVVLGELVRRRRILPARPEPEPIYRRAITEPPRHNAEVILR